MRREHLHELGTLLYGPRFGVQLAAALTEVGPKQATTAHLSAWLNGTRPIPAWVSVQARALVPVGIEDLQRRVTGLTMTLMRSGYFDGEPRQHASRIARLRQPHPDTVPPEDEPSETD